MNRSMISPDGIKYEPMENELTLPENMEKLIPGPRPDPRLAFRDPAQREYRYEAVRTETTVILRDPMGRCAVIGDRLHPLEYFLRGLLCKPRIEVQAKAAFQ